MNNIPTEKYFKDVPYNDVNAGYETRCAFIFDKLLNKINL